MKGIKTIFLFTIEENTNPIEIVLHVYKLKEGWDVNNLFTLVPLNAAKSEILALQTIGRGLRLPFGQITGQDELDTLDIVAHDHYRELIDDVKSNPIFRTRNLDENDVPQTKAVDVVAEFNDGQMALFQQTVESTAIKSFQDINDLKVQEELYKGYLKAFAKDMKPAQDDKTVDQMSLFDLEVFTKNVAEDLGTYKGEESKESKQKTKAPVMKKEEFIDKIKKVAQRSVSVPRISIGYSSTITFKPVTITRNIVDFDTATSFIERYDVINEKLLMSVEAVALETEDPVNELACMLLDSIDEFDSNDAEYIIDVVEQYLNLIEGSFEDKKKIVRRYATVIIDDIRKQVYASKEEHTEFIYSVERDLILFGKFVKNVKPDGKVDFKKEITDKKNIRQYLFTGYKKSYYPENGFDSDDERRMAVILEEDSEVVRWIKPPLNQLGLFYKAGHQYNPDFIVETSTSKYLVEVKASNMTKDEDVIDKARAAIKWCECATGVDADKKEWKFRLIAGQNIAIGNNFKYIMGMSENLEGLMNE